MNAALLQLLLLSFRGRLIKAVRMLKQPKYLVASAVGVLYFGWLIGRNFVGEDKAVLRLPGDELDPAVGLALHHGLALVLAVVATLSWLFVRPRPLRLQLTETEVHTLLPAPLSRWQVLGFAVLKSQVRLMLSALILGVLTYASGSVLARMAAFWLLLSLGDLHLKAANLWKARRDELPPRRALRQQAVLVAILVGFWMVVGQALWQTMPRVSLALNSPFPAEELARLSAEVAERPEIRAPLAPFLALARLTVPVGPRPWTAWLIAVALFLAHLFWVIRSRASFEDALVDQARQAVATPQEKVRAAARRRAHKQRSQVPFSLAAAGPPEVAIFWKNLMITGRQSLSGLLRKGLLLPAGVTAIVVLLRASEPVVQIGGAAAGFLAIFFPVFAGLVFRQDLRTDLERVDVLKSWPLAGWRLVAAEVAAPITKATLVSVAGLGTLLGITVGVLLVPEARPGFLDAARATFPALLVAMVCVPLLAAAVSAVSIGVQNLLVLMLPSWIPVGAHIQAQGISGTGQWILIALVQAIAMFIGALPATVAVGGLAFLLWTGASPPPVWALPLLALPAAVIFAVEACGLVAWAGRVWDRLDPSKELLAG